MTRLVKEFLVSGTKNHQSKIFRGKNQRNNSFMQAMAFPVVEFSRQGYKIRKVFG
jgi:hypothetical protein